MSDSQEARRLLTALEKAVMDYCERYQPVMTVEKSEEYSKALDDVLDEVRERLANWPATRSLDVGNGRTIEGSSYVVEDVRRRLESLPGLEQRAVAAEAVRDEAVKRAEHAERQNKLLREDVFILKGYLMRMVEEQRGPEPRFPKLNMERGFDEDEYPRRMGLDQLLRG